jgi:transaldolase
VSVNHLRELAKFGQSVWLDNISRDLLQTGELKRLIDEDGITGVTSNPTIFEKAMSMGTRYDADMGALAAQRKRVGEIYEALAVADIAATADLLRPTYELTTGADGYVSLEVSPHLAHDTQGTIAEATRLFGAVNRPNVMIKVPATQEGIPAISALIGAGLNINVTLIFALESYRDVALAYIQGLETLAGAGGDLAHTGSVASFFVSRVDTAVDKLLTGRPEEAELRGKAGIANARLAYADFQQIFAGPRWERLTAAGARVQRPLWASTSTKDPHYPDTMYADGLLGPHTVDTMPPQTIEAFRDHGHAALTITQDVEGARQTMQRLAAAGIDTGQVTQDLLAAGVKSFEDSFDKLMSGLERKVATLTPG